MKKEEEETIYGLIGIILFPIVILSSLWNTYILWDICVLFNLTYLTQYGYEIFFGSLFVLGIVVQKFRGYSQDPSAKQLVSQIIYGQLGMLLAWAMAYLLHWILSK